MGHRPVSLEDVRLDLEHSAFIGLERNVRIWVGVVLVVGGAVAVTVAVSVGVVAIGRFADAVGRSGDSCHFGVGLVIGLMSVVDSDSANTGGG